MLPLLFRPKGLYIHVPFCASRCSYCDFYVLISRNREQHLDYVRRILCQLDEFLGYRPDLLSELQTIFLGGGTPSLLGAEALTQLFHGLEQRIPNFRQLCEISMESNPELVHRDSLLLWQDLGLTRLSIGLQSQSDTLLKLLGRRSTQCQHEKLAQDIQKYFAGEYSFDFIYGIPSQSLADIQASLDFVAHYQPHHVSYYELSIEEGTLLQKWHEQGRLQETSESEEQFELLCCGLKALGYHRYEVANFARPSHPVVNLANMEEATDLPTLYISRHNALYWHWQPYLGLGPSAVSAAFLSGPSDPHARVWRMQGSGDFGSKSCYQSSHTLSSDESLWEYLLMGLRLRCGISTVEWTQLFWPETAGLISPRQARQYLQNLLRERLPQCMVQYSNFFTWQDAYLHLSDRGFDLQGAFLRDAYTELGL